jgi:MFS family permease
VPNTVKKKKPTVNPLIFFLQPDIMITLFYTGVVYAVNYTITATISSAFAKLYPFLSATTVGLCYLSTGGGMIFGSTLTGKMLDWDYRRMRRQWVGTDGVKDDFPLEKSRLRTMPILLAVYVGSVVAWGWCLEFRVSIAGPLVFQFVRKQCPFERSRECADHVNTPVGYTSISILNATMTLMIDIVPGQSSGVIACVCNQFLRLERRC